MAQNPVEQAAWQIAEPTLTGLGFALVDVEFIKEGQQWLLNIYIDKDGGVDLDDCEAASKALDPLLDADPAVAGRHDMLCVSSPGLDRPLKNDRDFARAMGQEIEVKLFTPIGGAKKLEGVLEGWSEQSLTLNGREIERKNIALARFAVHF